MPYNLEAFRDAGLGRALLDHLIDRHETLTHPRLASLWAYYRNPIAPTGGGDITRPRLAQERGLPSRISGEGVRRGAAIDGITRLPGWTRKEVVIENDIAWRIHTMVDFMFGRPVTITSTARDENKRRQIERILDAVWESSGGIALFQDIGLLGHVYGHVDLVVRFSGDASGGTDNGPPLSMETGESARDSDITRAVSIEVVDPTRAIPLQDPHDFRRLSAYIIRYRRESSEVDGSSSPFTAGRSTFLKRWFSGNGDGPNSTGPATSRRVVIVTEIITGSTRHIYEQDEGDTRNAPTLIHAGPALVASPAAPTTPPLPPPVVHIQNVSQPFRYEGLSEVEPLIPLQDELNTRLSDRASRVTLESFKMYLAKGLDGLETFPIGPGQVWQTDNPDAEIEPFGGDDSSPGEDAHIEQVREAMDKASGVPPLASGVVRAKIGNLSSENALRVTLMGLLSKTARKRITYGRGIAAASRLVLEALDRAGLFNTDEADRDVRVDWPDPLPRDERETLAAAKAKLDLGVPRERILAELGYAPTDPGVT